jgi:hypothetical protein
MKFKSALLTGLLLAAMPLALHAQQLQYKIDKVTPSLIQTPIYQYQGDQRQNPSQAGKWLEIEVQFEAVPEVTDELTAKFYVMINNVVLSGDVTYINVPKGREQYACMYVPPATLTRLMGGKPVVLSAITNVGVQLQVKGQAVYEKNSPEIAEWWTRFQQTSGLLLNKNQTPFAPLYWDRYPQIKTAGQ